jgi:hypothetical protein
VDAGIIKAIRLLLKYSREVLDTHS